MAESQQVISPEEGAELQRLHEAYALCTRLAADALRAKDRERFLEEEEKVADIVRRIKEIIGSTGQPWNA